MYIYLDYAVISGYRHKSFTTMFGHKTFKKLTAMLMLLHYYCQFINTL